MIWQPEFTDKILSRKPGAVHGLYFAVLGPLIGVLFLVLYIFFAKEPLVLWVIIHPIFLLLSITTGAIPALLTGVMVACLPEKIGSQKRYRCLAGGIGGVVITEIYCAVIVHIKGMASSELFENILSGDSLVVRIIPALLAGVVMSRIITRLPGLDISCPETDSLS
ncbi:inner membrane protein [Escherichia coli]|uniref:Inner membrane protein CbrB n=1 Tax=Escherichia coli TaxID=562 RepID=A0A377E045_ECOLX|nr:inner membrane protein [Escherichia coli]